jgi:hypothetical protein
VAGRAGSLAAAVVRHLASRDLRLKHFRAEVGGWIAVERRLGRLGDHEATALRDEVEGDKETADLAGLFVIHLLVGALKQSVLGPSAVWLALALATGEWWWALPALVAPMLRLLTAVGMGFLRRPGLLLLCPLPTVGVLAAPLYLLRRRRDLGAFIVRVLAQKAALAIPAFGQRGGLAEMLAVAATQILVIAPARMLPLVLAAAVLGVVTDMLWLSGLALLSYGLAVAWTLARWRRDHGKDLLGAGEWKLGLPEGAA